MEASAKLPTIAFVSAIALTIAAYLTRQWTAWAMGLTTLQGLIQVIFYFQPGFETRDRWDLIMLLFMITVFLVVVGGSLWIMYNLDYNVMPGM